MISKELLSEVLGKKVALDNNIQITRTTVHYSNVTHMAEINIYELAHKCKEWAISKNCRIFSEVQYSKHTKGARVEMVVYKGKDQVFISDMEPKAIFKACEWILKEKND